MTRTSRVLALSATGAIALAIVVPTTAMAAGTAAGPARQGAGSAVDIDNEFFAGYASSVGSKKSIIGTFTVPALGDCSDGDEGIYTGIELAADGGASYADGGVFSSCSGGTATHSPVFDTTTAEGQVPIDQVVEDGDKIKVTNRFKDNQIKITVNNVTQDWTVSDTFTGFTPNEAYNLYYSMTLGGSPLPPLSSDSAFKGVQVGGRNLKATDPTKYVLVDSAGDPIVKPTKIKNGTDFRFNYMA